MSRSRAGSLPIHTRSSARVPKRSRSRKRRSANTHRPNPKTPKSLISQARRRWITSNRLQRSYRRRRHRMRKRRSQKTRRRRRTKEQRTRRRRSQKEKEREKEEEIRIRNQKRTDSCLLIELFNLSKTTFQN